MCTLERTGPRLWARGATTDDALGCGRLSALCGSLGVLNGYSTGTRSRCTRRAFGTHGASRAARQRTLVGSARSRDPRAAAQCGRVITCETSYTRHHMIEHTARARRRDPRAAAQCTGRCPDPCSHAQSGLSETVTSNRECSANANGCALRWGLAWHRWMAGYQHALVDPPCRRAR